MEEEIRSHILGEIMKTMEIVTRKDIIRPWLDQSE